MGGGKRSASAPSPPQHMYFLEGGLLVVDNLLKTDAWVHDEVRTHCNVCVQQFLPFRRRHHCRTCGEVVCGGCSSQRKIRLTDVNVECATRVCTFCMIRATDASIKANETAMRETLAMGKRRMSIMPVQSNHPGGGRNQQYAICAGNGGAQHGGNRQQPQANNGRNAGMRQKQLSMWSMDSELTNGSVVQLWPQPIPDDESARLQIVRNSVILRSENDPTMNLLVSIVARTLQCPVAFIGILDDNFLWFKASVGWDATHIPRDDCVCSQTLAQGKTMIVPDTNLDKHFHANNLSIDARPLRYYAGSPIRVMGRCIGAVCALDTSPHRETSSAMRSTLEAVANIVSEVLEQRVDGSSATRGTETTVRSMNRAHTGMSTFLHVPLSETASDSSSDRSSSTSDGGGLLDLHASLQGLNLADYASSQGSSDDLEWTDPSPSMYLAMSSVPPEYGEKIGVSMEFFQRLQSTLWCERPSQDGIKAFELFRSGRHFTRANTKLSGTCAEAVAHLQNYEDARIYDNMFANVTRRYKLSAQTWMDEIVFKPNGISPGKEGLRVLTHSRQYPDGSTVVVAMNSSKIYEADGNDMLFGWFVAPCSLHDGLGSVNVSCIVAQSYHENNQLQDEHLGCDLLLRLRQCLAQAGKRPVSPPPALSSFDMDSVTSTVTLGSTASTPSRLGNHSVYSDRLHDSSNQQLLYQDLVPAAPSPVYDNYAHYRQSESSFDNQHHHEASTLFLGITRPISKESFGSFASSSTSTDTGCAKIVPIASRSNQLQMSNLNQNERMMLDLLDKTISTQEILAAQQHEMANVIDYHGTQLQRISTAIERVETLLADSNEKLKRMPQPKVPRRSMC
uniref:FYVE-type domain-containing protein n=1 Tax=Globisporangium ultimum (strain ATCC 200006 / CBS 805.95 / DAOM BR144) TaxID=431595 RepID=K3WYA8_GLOUD